VCAEEVKPWVENPEFRAEMDAIAAPNFGETAEELKLAASGEPFWKWSKEEEEEIAKFWEPIDAEIKEDQKREAEERAAKKQQQQQQQQ